MRLRPNELRAITTAFAPALLPIGGKLFLFGSRTDDSKRGGDIDLLVVVSATQVDHIKQSKLHLIDRIHSQIGEQKIDLTVVSPDDFSNDPFVQSLTLVPLTIPGSSESAP